MTALLTHSETSSSWATPLVDLYRTHNKSLIRLAQRFVCDRALAEDCVQEAFLAFHAKGVQPKPGRELSYLRSMVRNGAISRVRKESRSQQYLRSQSPIRVGSAEDLALAHISSARLAETVVELPNRQGEVVCLSLAGLSVAETATALRISTGTVKTHRHRAAAALRTSLSSERHND